MKKIRKLKWLIGLLVPLSVLAAAIWMVGSYEDIHVAKREDQTVRLSDWSWLLRDMSFNLNYDLLGQELQFDSNDLPLITEQAYVEWMQQKAEEPWREWDELVDEYHSLSEEKLQELSQQFWEDQAHWDLLSRWSDISNIQYYAVNRQNGQVLNSTQDHLLENVATGDVDNEALAQEFQDVVVLDYDQNGQLSVTFPMDTNRIVDTQSFDLNGKVVQQTIWVGENAPLWQAPADTTFVFAIPHQLLLSDTISRSIDRNNQQAIGEQLLLHALFALAAVGIVALLVPVHTLREKSGWRLLMRLPLEIVAVLGTIAVVVVVQVCAEIVLETLNRGQLGFAHPMVSWENGLLLLNYAMWLGAFAIVAFLILYVKNVFLQGFKKSLTRNTIILGLPYGIYRLSNGKRREMEAEIASEKKKVARIVAAAGEMAAPIGTIKEQVLYLKNTEDQNTDDALDIIDGAAWQLSKISENLYEGGKAAIGELRADLQPVDLANLAQEALYEFEGEYLKKEIQIRTNFPEQPVLALADPVRTLRIFKKLSGNIASYAMKKTRAYIELTAEADVVKVTFKNMSAEELNVDLDSPEMLGLATLKGLTELQGGTFKVLVDGDLFKVELSFLKSE